MTNHLDIGSSVRFDGAVWRVETRVGGVYQLKKGAEIRLARREQIKRYVPRKGEV